MDRRPRRNACEKYARTPGTRPQGKSHLQPPTIRTRPPDIESTDQWPPTVYPPPAPPVLAIQH
eukprot:5317581-Lingulodinium_polyedra.AAC.1